MQDLPIFDLGVIQFGKFKLTVMKALKWIAWISGGIGILFVISGLIQSLFGQWDWGRYIINYFLVADSFFLITIALFIFIYRCDCKK